MALALGGRFPDWHTDSPARQGRRRRRAGSSGPATTTEGATDLRAFAVAPNGLLPASIQRTESTESGLATGKAAETSPTIADLNFRLIKQSFAAATSDGPAAMEDFYARLFSISPAFRSLFPTSMSTQRERMLEALERVVCSLDSEPDSAALLRQLGRDHRRYGVRDKYYGEFFAALRDTIRHRVGASWTTETSVEWQRALDYVAAGMRAGAAADDAPAWWVAEIVAHEMRAPGVAVLRLCTDTPLPYQAGQYVPVQVTKWPRIWRPYSVATAPRSRGLLELHVRAVSGGLVSNALVHDCGVGDCVLLGAASGSMTLTDSGRDLLCVAGGTGLAPIKAIIEEAIAAGKGAARPRKITLFAGARQHVDLYDLENLRLLEATCPALRVIPVLSEQPDYTGLTGMVPDTVSGYGLFTDAEAYVCGPPAMVRQATALLAASLPAARIHYDPLP